MGSQVGPLGPWGGHLEPQEGHIEPQGSHFYPPKIYIDSQGNHLEVPGRSPDGNDSKRRKETHFSLSNFTLSCFLQYLSS